MVRTSSSAGRRGLVGISAVLLLIGVFAGPALAEHATPGPAVVPTVETFPGGDPICPAGTTGIRFGGGGASLDSGTSSGGVTITHDGTTLSFTTDGVLVAKVFMKGGNDQNVYDYSGFTGGGVAHDDGLTSPINPNNNTPFGISHVDFCVFTPDPTPTPEATPTPTDPPTPTPTDPPTPTPTDPPTPTPEATPTPSPTLPDTFTAPTTGLDGAGGQGTIFLLLLIGTAVGAWLLLKPVRRREDEA